MRRRTRDGRGRRAWRPTFSPAMRAWPPGAGLRLPEGWMPAATQGAELSEGGGGCRRHRLAEPLPRTRRVSLRCAHPKYASEPRCTEDRLGSTPPVLASRRGNVRIRGLPKGRMTRATNEGRPASRIVSLHGLRSTSRPGGPRTASALHITRNHQYEAIIDTAKQKGCDLGRLTVARDLGVATASG